MEGSGRMLVVAVGLNSQTGRILELLGLTASHGNKRKQAMKNCWTSTGAFLTCKSKHIENNTTKTDVELDKLHAPEQIDLGRSQSPMQKKLEKLSIKIGYIGVVAAIVTSLVLSLRFTITHWNTVWTTRYVQVFVRFIILGVTVIVVSVPEGLPLAVTLALAYSVRVC